MSKGGMFHFLFHKPLIAWVPFDGNMLRVLPYLARRAAGQQFHVLLYPTWSMRLTFDQRRGELQPLMDQFANMNVVILAQEPNDQVLIRNAGHKSILANHNAFLDEKIIAPIPDMEKKYDAIYVGRLSESKRHHLAYEVPNAVVLTAKFGIDIEVAAEIVAGYKYLDYVNFSRENGVELHPPNVVNRFLSQSRCGLALSAAEGAMFAAGEYALAGIPIVSTPSIGGRDQFFHSDWVEIVEATPDAVAQGVSRFRDTAPPAIEIRQRMLDMVRPHRLRVIDWLEQTCGRKLHHTASDTGWLPQFIHRMRKWNAFV